MRRWLLALLMILISGACAHAAPALDGAAMSWPWALPFAGILLSIATGPLLFPKIWHNHYGKIAAGWAASALISIAVVYGPVASLAAFVHAMLAEYLSFIVLLFALYTVAGGILITGNLRGTPATNTAILTFGTSIASIVGTTGAAMILIRPLLRANESRRHNVHVFVFFIILVANVGGALSPLGDPPLFVGFLRGVDFFWTTQHLWLQTLVVAAFVLTAFFAVDTWFHRSEAPPHRDEAIHIGVQGHINIALIAAIIGLILLSSKWNPGIAFDILGTPVALQNLARDGALIVVSLLSLWLTPKEHRASNGFSWEPIREVAKLFAGIFVAIIPVLAMLQAGRTGAFAWLIGLVTGDDGSPRAVAYYWLTGLLSAFLDNAPTYLVFYEVAGGNAQQLMGPLAATLAGTSMGAVYMGALTYIGNAPNFMIYAIASERGIRMPSFFGYLFWATLILLPPLLIVMLLPWH